MPHGGTPNASYNRENQEEFVNRIAVGLNLSRAQWAINRRATAMTPVIKAESITISAKLNEPECLSLTGANEV